MSCYKRVTPSTGHSPTCTFRNATLISQELGHHHQTNSSAGTIDRGAEKAWGVLWVPAPEQVHPNPGNPSSLSEEPPGS